MSSKVKKWSHLNIYHNVSLVIKETYTEQQQQEENKKKFNYLKPKEILCNGPKVEIHRNARFSYKGLKGKSTNYGRFGYT